MRVTQLQTQRLQGFDASLGVRTVFFFVGVLYVRSGDQKLRCFAVGFMVLFRQGELHDCASRLHRHVSQPLFDSLLSSQAHRPVYAEHRGVCRAAMHKVLHASGTAWHHCARALCDIISSVAADLEPLAANIAGGSDDAMQGNEQRGTGSLAPRPRFLALASIAAAAATVMLHHASARIALAARVMQRHIIALLSFADHLVSSSLATGTTDAALPSVLQFVAAWLALMHRVTPLHALANALEGPIVCPALVAMLPEELPASWRQPRAPPPLPPGGGGAEAAAHSSAQIVRPVDSSVDAVVVQLVERAFAQALAHATASAGDAFERSAAAEAAAAARTAHHSEASARDDGAAASGSRPAVPLWLAVLAVIDTALGKARHILHAPQQGCELTAGSPPTMPHRVCAAGWSLLAVLTPALEPVARFCTHVDALPAALGGPALASERLPWAKQVWAKTLQSAGFVLKVPSAENPEVSRAVASYLVTLCAHEAGESAIASVCAFLCQRSQDLLRASALTHEGDAPSQKEVQPQQKQQEQQLRFQAVFAIHLLQTTVRKAGLGRKSRAALLKHIAGMLAGQQAAPFDDAADAGMLSRSGHVLAGLGTGDCVHIASIAAGAVQQGSVTGTPGSLAAGNAVPAAQTFTYACAMFARIIADMSRQVSRPLSPEAAAAIAADTGHVQALVSFVQLLGPLLSPHSSSAAAALLHMVDLLVVMAVHLGDATEAAIDVDLNPSLAGPLPGQTAEDPKAAAAQQSTPPVQLLACAAALLQRSAAAQVLGAHNAASVALLCSTAAALPGSAGEGFSKALQTIIASGAIKTPAKQQLVAHDAEHIAASLSTAAATVKAAVQALRTAMSKQQAQTQLAPGVAHVLLRELLQALPAAESEAATKVLKPPGMFHLSCVCRASCAQCYCVNWRIAILIVGLGQGLAA